MCIPVQSAGGVSTVCPLLMLSILFFFAPFRLRMSVAVITVVHDAPSAASAETLEQLARISAASSRPFRVELLNVSGGAALRDVLRPAATTGRRGEGRNYFTTSMASKDATVETARLLERWNAVFLGCDCRQYSYDEEDITMMSCYAEVPMRNFVVLDGQRPNDSLRAAALTLPVVVRGTEQNFDDSLGTAANADQLDALLRTSLERYPKVFVTEAPVEEEPVKARLLIAAFGPTKKDVLWTATDAPEASVEYLRSTVAPSLSANLLTHNGTATVHLLCYPDGKCIVSGVTIGFALWDVLVLSSPNAAVLFSALLDHADAAYAAKQPNYVVVFDAKTKGYHLRASRNIKKGDVVFPDEGRTFAVVTKEHVRATWSEEDKVVFTRYAWPLDADGHVYAIWEEDPKRWRPINHSCSPTCANKAPHSLNVEATRDIAEGEDLTMDYATFCDYTMKPFQCHCGFPECRGLIQPDAASLSKYLESKQSWHRGPRDPNDTL
jgi:hypothetical protein